MIMKRTLNWLLLLTFSIFSFNAMSADRIESIDYKSLSANHFFDVNYQGKDKPTANLEFKSNVIQLSLPNTIVWPKQEKRVRPEGANFDVSILAYQFTKDSVRFRVVFPDAYKVDQSKVSLKNTRNGYRIIWKNDNAVTKAKSKYDDSFLSQLLKEEEKKPRAKAAKVQNDAIKVLEKSLKEDKVNTAQAATKKENSSINDYMMKFVMIILVLGVLFFISLQLVRKGVLKQGKLNFLRNTHQIEQISSTHLSPKRSLHLVKVAGQVFFIGATDSGISLLSEISSPGSVLKEAEKILTGDNFESSLTEMEETKTEETSNVKLKEDITQSSDESLEEKKTEFVNQLKQRVKNLKSLQ
jgi:flagellar biogenesis protein FliO